MSYLYCAGFYFRKSWLTQLGNIPKWNNTGFSRKPDNRFLPAAEIVYLLGFVYLLKDTILEICGLNPDCSKTEAKTDTLGFPLSA